MPASAVGTIVAEILGEARRRGGTVYNKIKNALAFHVNTYAQFLEDVAKGVKKGEMTVTEAAEAVKTAALLLSTSVWSQVKQIALAQIQHFLNAVIGAVKGAINAALPIPVL